MIFKIQEYWYNLISFLYIFIYYDQILIGDATGKLVNSHWIYYQ